MEVKSSASMKRISAKPQVHRRASAQGTIVLGKKSARLLSEGSISKGDAFAAAQFAGINAAKQTHLLIPLCHQIPLTSVSVSLHMEGNSVRCVSEVEANYSTGVEMEALVAVSVALLTIWDMVKEYEKDSSGQYPETRITNVCVTEKRKGE